jgi:hypothetical protein
MVHIMYYVFEGLNAIENKNGYTKTPIDIATSPARPDIDDSQLVAEVSSVEELEMLFSDRYWARGKSHRIRQAEDLHPDVRARLVQILYRKEDKRLKSRSPPPKAILEKRRKRTYRSFK